MAFHELIMNAMRFGVTDVGGISVTWGLKSEEGGDIFQLVWSEPAVAYADLLAQEEGFGALVLSRKGLDPSTLLMLQSFPFRSARLARVNKGDALSLSAGL